MTPFEAKKAALFEKVNSALKMRDQWARPFESTLSNNSALEELCDLLKATDALDVLYESLKD